MDHRTSEQFYMIVSPGLEETCANELLQLGIKPDRIEHGGVAFTGTLRDLYLANLQVRTASRILVRFADLQSRSFPDLYRKARKLPWGRFIKPKDCVSLSVSSRKSRLNHTGRIAETLESAINQALGRATNPTEQSPQRVLVRVVEDRVTLSIDSSGELLHRRGYRTKSSAAPLRETLAAGLLLQLQWNGDTPLVDPMCGTGSFLAEGFLLACNKAPGLNRRFAFMQWPGFRQGLWNLLCSEAQRHERNLHTTLAGYDANLQAVAAAQENCREIDSSAWISIEHKTLGEQEARTGQGLVVCNPPYGKRLSLQENAEESYAEYGRELKRVFPGWRKALVCPDVKLIKATGLSFEEIALLNNGGLQVGLYVTDE